jgi:beta-xylosidase
LSDDFGADKYARQWTFFKPGPTEADRLVRDGDGLRLRAAGTAPKDSSPLLFVVGDQSYEIEAEIELEGDAVGGLLLFYDQSLYCGLGFDGERFVTHQYGLERARPANPFGRRLWMRLRNRRHIVSYWLSADSRTWTRFDRGMEVSGYHHNVRGGFLMLKPGLYAAGRGAVRYRDFRYRAL